ncbi:Uncharacterised protein [Sebaldella termitidis]|uniref:Uncharacterized protein n=1 Tax=Sebaldella termitidis (strain ATCC 33386 / NCTC 11300) TaxID=526218 RepID=D1AR04_SEBTE|nr:hypothetical protein [Sebaldella termitidis]ACZ07692.1 hypothetical protein Sterm_0820 [Sebaldella termitidis ATCC 33386]SUI22988.1 Uncharacterised protein [Sebaldella termitidis]
MNFEIEDIVVCAMFLQREFSDEILSYTAEEIVKICESIIVEYEPYMNSLDEYLESEETRKFIEKII